MKGEFTDVEISIDRTELLDPKRSRLSARQRAILAERMRAAFNRVTFDALMASMRSARIHDPMAGVCCPECGGVLLHRPSCRRAQS